MARRWISTLCWASLLLFTWLPHCPAQHMPETRDVQHAAEATEGLISPSRIPGVSVDHHTVPANVTVITAEDIRHSHASTIQDVLAKVEGVTFSDQQGFGLGSDSTVNLRGVVNSSRTGALVLVDGVRQNRLTGDEVHWQSIPVHDIERIEIIRGGSGLIYGDGALSGVINILTKQEGEKLLETEEGAEGGSYGWQQYFISARGRARPLTYGLSYTRRLVDGYRNYSASRNTTITVHTGLELGPLVKGMVHVLHSEDTTEFPGGLTPTRAKSARRTAGSFNGFFSNDIDQVSTDLVLGPWAGMSTAINWFWRRWVDHSVDSSAGNPFESAPSQGLSLRTSSELATNSVTNLAVSGLEVTADKATTGFPTFPPDNESNRRGYGLYFEDTLSMWDRLSLVGGLRFDRFDYNEAISSPAFDGSLRFKGFSPKVGLTYALIPKTWDCFASYSRPFKAPNVDDFASQFPDFASNVHLKPQQATAYELGTRFTKTPLTAKTTWFYTRTTKEILFNQLAFQNQNVDTQRTGVESSLQVMLPDDLRSYLTYTFVAPVFRKGPFTHNTIPGTPAHTVTAGLGLSPLESLWVDLDVQLISNFYRINDLNNSLKKANTYGVLNLTLQYQLPKHFIERGCPALTTYLKIQNVTNRKYITFQSSNGKNLLGAGDYPMPPITFTAGVSMQF